MSKLSRRRPIQSSRKDFDNSWDRIFSPKGKTAVRDENGKYTFRDSRTENQTDDTPLSQINRSWPESNPKIVSPYKN